MKFFNKINVLNILLTLTLFLSLNFSNSKQTYINTLNEQLLKINKNYQEESLKATYLKKEVHSLKEKLNTLKKENLQLKERNDKLKKQLHT